MSKSQKLITRLLGKPKDFTWSELVQLLNSLGFYEHKSGHTGGSKRKFVNPKTNLKISIHKPHPKEILKSYQVTDIIKSLNKK
ncbi:MAG: type II toxin-antitoxin system HicA family toxin [Candidatus Pacebacteria bacterium]|nr:type II toxin-antitoxin system HicA family toxin [Candidatus Paceibacterota bacterium]